MPSDHLVSFSSLATAAAGAHANPRVSLSPPRNEEVNTLSSGLRRHPTDELYPLHHEIRLDSAATPVELAAAIAL